MVSKLVLRSNALMRASSLAYLSSSQHWVQTPVGQMCAYTMWPHVGQASFRIMPVSTLQPGGSIVFKEVDVSFAAVAEGDIAVDVSVAVWEFDWFPGGVGSDFDVMVLPTY